MKRIIHLSDLHVGYDKCSDRYRTIIDKLITDKDDQSSDYIIVITGDLIDNAHHPESNDDLKAGLDKLKQAGFNHILVVPGNHDYGTGDLGDKKFVKPFQQTYYSDDKGFPRKDIIDGIAFLGLDSIAGELNWYDAIFAEGELGSGQLARLDASLKEKDVASADKRVIYLHHHPFDFRPLHQLKDSDKLKKVLLAAMGQGISIDAILYGHNHEGKAHNGQWGIVRCYDGGTATLKPRPDYVDWSPWFQTKSSIRDIDIGKEDAHCDYELSLL